MSCGLKEKFDKKMRLKISWHCPFNVHKISPPVFNPDNPLTISQLSVYGTYTPSYIEAYI